MQTINGVKPAAGRQTRPFNQRRNTIEGIIVSNLLLITDLARLRDVFGSLADDRDIRLRIASSLEKGAEELAREKPDVVFVQTHLSGLSADILLMHLKKQLGRKRSRFVLLAAPNQVSEAILAPYKGWLDTSAEDGVLLVELRNLLVSLTTRPKKIADAAVPEAQPAAVSEMPPASTEPPQDPESGIDTIFVPALPDPAAADNTAANAPTTEPAPEASLEEQGLTYSPRSRLTVYSEFNSSFDDAVSSAPAPELLAEVAPTLEQSWKNEPTEPAPFSAPRSKRASFAFWLAPVIIAVVAATFLQQRKPSTPPEAVVATSPALPSQTQAPQQQERTSPSGAIKNGAAPSIVATPAQPAGDKALLADKPEAPSPKDPAVRTAQTPPPAKLPDFIPRSGFDKGFSAANPGWERYKGLVTEFKVFRESGAIKAIQVIDRGGQGVPESFMKGVLKQVIPKPLFTLESSEKKDGYQIQRGYLSPNLKVIYYRDADGKKLRAFVLNWQ